MSKPSTSSVTDASVVGSHIRIHFGSNSILFRKNGSPVLASPLGIHCVAPNSGGEYFLSRDPRLQQSAWSNCCCCCSIDLLLQSCTLQMAMDRLGLSFLWYPTRTQRPIAKESRFVPYKAPHELTLPTHSNG